MIENLDPRNQKPSRMERALARLLDDATQGGEIDSAVAALKQACSASYHVLVGAQRGRDTTIPSSDPAVIIKDILSGDTDNLHKSVHDLRSIISQRPDISIAMVQFTPDLEQQDERLLDKIELEQLVQAARYQIRCLKKQLTGTTKKLRLIKKVTKRSGNGTAWLTTEEKALITCRQAHKDWNDVVTAFSAMMPGRQRTRSSIYRCVQRINQRRAKAGQPLVDYIPKEPPTTQAT